MEDALGTYSYGLEWRSVRQLLQNRANPTLEPRIVLQVVIMVKGDIFSKFNNRTGLIKPLIIIHGNHFWINFSFWQARLNFRQVPNYIKKIKISRKTKNIKETEIIEEIWILIWTKIGELIIDSPLISAYRPNFFLKINNCTCTTILWLHGPWRTPFLVPWHYMNQFYDYATQTLPNSIPRSLTYANQFYNYADLEKVYFLVFDTTKNQFYDYTDFTKIPFLGLWHHTN